MTDSSPSNTDLTKEQLQLMDDARASLEAIVCDPVAIAMQKRITELEQDAARYESGREALCIVIDTQKDKIKQLEMAERMNVETVANFQKRIDELERSCAAYGELTQAFRERLAEVRASTPPSDVLLIPTALVAKAVEWMKNMESESDGEPDLEWLRVRRGLQERLPPTKPEAHSKSQQKRIATQQGGRKFKIGDCVQWGSNRKGVVQGPADQGTRVLVKWQGTQIIDAIEGSELARRGCDACDEFPSLHSYDANGSPVEPPDCPHCDGFLVDGTVLHGPRCPTVETSVTHPGFRKLTDAVIAGMRWTCAHGNVYERWVATAACGCDRPALSEPGEQKT